MAEVKELNELMLFVKDVALLIIKEARTHKGAPADAVKDIILGLVKDNMRQELVDAFMGLGELPAEVVAADVATWIGFAINQVMVIPEIVAAFTEPVSA